MQILHLNLLPQGADHAALRYFFNNPNVYESRILPLQAIADLVVQAETEVYVPAVLQDLVATGKRLYEWLDGSDRWLGQALEQDTILAITAGERLAHLPWELLHDGTTYLVQRLPSVVPVRWVSQLGSRYVPQLEAVNAPQNRALNLMFMATSPRGVEPVLHFEEEEGRILTATQRQSHQRIALLVEESGNLEELGFAIKAYGTQHFDGLHLTGHATIQNGQPRFVMETATGDPAYESAADIASTLQGYLPPLLFLSGCRTGEGAQAGAVPSMAEALLAQGATAVLGWGKKVLDTDATEAAAVLYGALSQGETLALALAQTYRHLLEANARDWHLLRLYVADTLPGPLVTSPRTPGRRPAPPPSTTTEFLDPVTQQVKVVGRQGFVGRRRQLQNCLRVLTQATDQAGVLIHGMGGLGKSALAARLCDRLPHTRRIVWVGRVDEFSLINKLSAALDDRALREMLQDPSEPLRYRLRRLMQTLIDQAQPPLLLVLDDFEANLEPRNASYVATPQAAQLLDDVLWAMGQTYYTHRLIITSRYDVEHAALATVTRQPLEALHGVDLQKKCNGLAGFVPPPVARDADEETLQRARQTVERQQRAMRLADGNPRLLEWLDKVLRSGDPPRPPLGKGGEEVAQNPSNPAAVVVDAILDVLEQNPVELREQVLAATLLGQMDEPMQAMLRRGLVYQLPVPRAALEAVCQCPPFQGGVGGSIDPAIALGLLEVSPEGDLRVPRILPLTLPAEAEALYGVAAQTLYRLWRATEGGISEEQALELVRVGLAAKDAEIAVGVGDRIATAWNKSSRYTDVLALCHSILEVFENVYCILGTIAQAEQMVGLVAEAVGHYETVLEQCLETDLESKAATLNNMAGVVAQQGDIERALSLWQESLEILERIGNIKGKAAVLGNMAKVIAQQGDIERALALWQESLEIKERIGDVKGKATALGNMAGVVAQQGDIERALSLWQESLEITEGIDDVQGKAATLNDIAQVVAQQGDVDRALALLQESLEIKERIDDVQGKATTLNDMAVVIAQQGDIERALSLWQESLEIWERIGYIQGKSATLSNMAQMIAQQGDIEQTLALLQESLAISERIGNVKVKAVILANMAYMAGKTGDKARQLSLNLQAAKALGQVKAFNDLFAVLANLGTTAEDHAEVYQSQALWLALRIQTPLQSTLALILYLFKQVPQGDALGALLATTALFLCQTHGQAHPQLESLQQAALQLLSTAARAQGMQTEEQGAAAQRPRGVSPPAQPAARGHGRRSWVFDSTHFT